MVPLQGIDVLVTRPAQQATPLCRLLEAQGARAWRLPAIEIKPLLESRARLETRQEFDIILFTSANAVRHGAAALQPGRAAIVAAIGPATARALDELGHAVTIQPDGGYTSEALLAHPSLKHLAGRRVLLIKGVGGRQSLAAELGQRGADVVAIDVYERVPATPSVADLAALHGGFLAGQVRVITATSLEIGGRLLEIVPKELRLQFQKAHWLVPGERVAAGLRHLGIEAPILTAASAEDHDLVAELGRWRSSPSAA